MKFKNFISGFIIGAISMSTVGVFAANSLVSAYLVNDYTIKVDGEILPVEEGFAILNYSNRTYTSVRSIAEALGAEVAFDAGTVSITPKQPEIVEVEKIVEKEVIKEVEVEPDYTPVVDSALDIRFVISDAEVMIDDAVITMDVNSYNSLGVALVKRSSIKLIDSKGNEHIVISGGEQLFNSLVYDEELEKLQLRFAGFEKDEVVTLVIPVEYSNNGSTEKDEIRTTFKLR